MPQVLLDSDIADLEKAGLKNLGRGRFQQIAQRLQRYEVMGRLLDEQKIEFDGGTGIQRRVMTDTSDQARMTSLYATDQTRTQDVLAVIDIGWRYADVPYSWDRREIDTNSGPEKIVDMLEIRRADAMVSLADLLETQFWNKPASSADKVDLLGIDYWLVYNATVGHNGGDPAGFSDGAGGLSTGQYPRWKNFTGQYTDVTKADLLRTMKKGCRKCNFQSPVNVNDFMRGNGQNYRFYMNEETIAAMEDLGEAQNENIGRDLFAFYDQMTFKRHPLVYVPQLDANTNLTDPVYGVDWSTFQIVCKSQDYLRESEPMPSKDNHNGRTVWIDLSLNVLCVDRRRNMVFAKGAAA